MNCPSGLKLNAYPPMESLTIDVGEWLRSANLRLHGVDRPAAEAQILLEAVLNLPRTVLITHPERILSTDEVQCLESMLLRRLAGEPLPYLLGHWEFYGFDLLVSPAVLIPRPETELLVVEAISWLQKNPTRRRTADVGVGTGAITIALAASIPDLSVVATDISRPALQLARRNIKRRDLAIQVLLAQMDLLTAIRGPFDLVCANLPYIPSAALNTLPVAKTEPRLALDGGLDGLDQIRRLLTDSPRWMAAGGCMLLEIEAGQGYSAPDLAHSILPKALVQVLPDLAGLPRLLCIDF